MTKQRHNLKAQVLQRKYQKTKTPARSTSHNKSGVRLNNISSPQAVAAGVTDSRLQTVQRQALAAEMGQTQGNHYLQGLIGSLKPGTAKDAPAIQRKETSQDAPDQAVTTRAQAEAVLQQRWGVGKITEGTQESQAKEIAMMNSEALRAESTPPDVEKMLAEAGWQAWSPPDGSKVWGWLVNAFEDFSQTFGGVPPVQEIVFYETAYRFIPSARGGPKLVPKPVEHASFSGGQLNVNHAAETNAPNRGLPAGRTKPKSDMHIPKASTEAGFRFTMVHELGHGLLEEKIKADMQQNKPSDDFIKAYCRQVGWFDGLLYDVGVEAVREALKKGERPHYMTRISGRWGDGKW